MPATRRSVVSVLAVFLLVALGSWAAREANALRFYYPDDWLLPRPAPWFSVEPDGLYHLRRVARQFEEGAPPAATDPLMNFPEGAPIPWPPYYDQALYWGAAAFAPAQAAERAADLETTLATLPHWFGVAASLLVALSAWLLAGAPAALLAGLYHALCYGSVHYSLPGVADHHAWVAALYALLLLSAALAMGALAQQRPRRVSLWACAAGAAMGLLLGSWVASLIYLALLQLGLAWWLLRDASGPGQPGLAALGLLFHGSAAAVLAPAVWASPWKEEHPWMVVNLSWFHLAYLLLGALVFVPLLLLKRGSTARRRYPWILGALLLAAAAALWFGEIGPGTGLKEGFAWAARANSFMSGIGESEPLLGRDRTGSGGLFTWLGFGVLLAPLAWLSGLRAAWREREPRLWPWICALPVLLVQALAQRRFSDALSLPLSLLLGWWAARYVNRRWSLLAAALLVTASHAPSLIRSADRWSHREADKTSISALRQIGYRSLHAWLADRAPRPRDFSVLAHWDQGHALEWVASCPSVATNFGSYVGEESFRDPASFFTAADPAEAEAILERRRARYVLVHSMLPAAWRQLQETAGRAPPWRDAVAAALSLSPGRRLGHLDFLRAVFVAPYPDLQPDPRLQAGGGAAPAGFVWERVPGARVEVRGPPGAQVEIFVRVEFAWGRVSFPVGSSGVLDQDGRLQLRWPYATDAPNGDGRVVEAWWSLDGERRELRVPESAVLGGEMVVLT